MTVRCPLANYESGPLANYESGACVVHWEPQRLTLAFFGQRALAALAVERTKILYESFSSLDALDPNQARPALKSKQRILAEFFFSWLNGMRTFLPLNIKCL